MGESLDRLEEFRADGMASRILGFGDIVGLMKDFEEVVDQEKAEKDAKRMLEGSNVLLLDEPTNDLDLWTLRVLEEALVAFLHTLTDEDILTDERFSDPFL